MIEIEIKRLSLYELDAGALFQYVSGDDDLNGHVFMAIEHSYDGKRKIMRLDIGRLIEVSAAVEVLPFYGKVTLTRKFK